MRSILTGLAASIATAAFAASPATAEHWSDPGFGAAANVTVHHGGSNFGNWSDGRRDRRHGRHDRGSGFIIGGWGYYDDNESWQPDSYNDWWHDRPNRSMPRWVRNNSGCERMWWSGGGWTC